MAEDNKAFPYTDDFRRAKRNSLLWSGVTVVAAFGSPPIVGETTFGHLGLSLTYDKSVILGVSGTIAVFMIVGFYQAYRRIRMHASQLFAGNTDVDQVFLRLREKAGAAVDRIEQIDSNLVSVLSQVSAGDFRELFGKLDILGGSLENFLPGIEQDVATEFNNENRIQPKSSDDAEKILHALNSLLHRCYSDRSSNMQIVQSAKKNLEKIENDVSFAIDRELDNKKSNINNEESRLQNDISKLMRFHSGIYSSEVKWFWGFDVAPVIVLFILAMAPFLRMLTIG